MRKNMGTTNLMIKTITGAIVSILLVNGAITGTLAVILYIFAVAFSGTSGIDWFPLYTSLESLQESFP